MQSHHNNSDHNQNNNSSSLPTYEQAPSYSTPKNIGLPYTYNWNGYDGLPVKDAPGSLTWSNFPAGEATAFPITSVDADTLNNPAPINGQAVPPPQDTQGNPVNLTSITTKNLANPYTMAVSLVPKRTGPTPHVHWSDAEWFYVLSGALDLWVGSNEYGVGQIPGQDGQPLESNYYYVHVKAGQMVQGHPGMLHSFTNTQDEPAVWLTFWQRNQSQLPGGIEQFFTRGDISPFVTDYQASVDYTNSLTEEQSNARKEHWGETFPLYNVTISNKFGQYLTSQQTDPVYANAPGPNNSSVNYNIPLEAVQDNGSEALNGLLSSTPELRVSLNSTDNGTVEVKNDADTSGVAINILFRTNQLADNVTEVGYYIVDPLATTASNLAKSQLIFSTLEKDNQGPVSVNSNRNIKVETGQTLAFYVKDTDGIKLSTAKDLSSNGHSSFTVNFSNGMSITGELNGAISSLQDVIGGTHLNNSLPLLDTHTLTSKTIIIESTQSREALFNSVAGFYKIVDESGSVKDPLTGNIIKPGDTQYQSVALDSANKLSELTFSVDNYSSKTQSGTFNGGYLYAPFIQVSNSELNSEFTYFAFQSANADNSQHIVSLGTNIFGFEDMPNSGDRDFNDLIVQANFSLPQQLSTIAP